MAKRKRLSPAPSATSENPPGTGTAAPSAESGLPGYGRRRAAPIADVAGDAASASAADEMAEALRRAREEGRMVLSLPLSSIETGYLVRDRMGADETEMAALMSSLRSRGQQTPIEVARLEGGRYGLISGWRRLTALRRLYEETGETRFSEVQALLRQPDRAADAYLAMIEENEIRVGLSYYERARIAARAAEQGVFSDDAEALRGLYGNASRARRSKIGSFMTIVRALDGDLYFPQDLGERMGLKLAGALAANASLADMLRTALSDPPPPTAEVEQTRIAAMISGHAAGQPAPRKKTGWETEIVAGVTMLTHPDGSVTLKGEQVDDGLRTRLERWLVQDLTRS